MEQQFTEVFKLMSFPILNSTFKILDNFSILGFSNRFINFFIDVFDCFEPLM